MLRHLSANKQLIPSLFRYLFIGGLVFVIDAGSFQLLLGMQLYRPVATTISYTLAVITHFSLNKFLNFRSFERSTLKQLRTYLVVVTFCWIVTMLVIEGSIHYLGFQPFWAKVLAILVNVPTGFVGHRYLTFGQGITPLLRRWFRNKKRLGP